MCITKLPKRWVKVLNPSYNPEQTTKFFIKSYSTNEKFVYGFVGRYNSSIHKGGDGQPSYVNWLLDVHVIRPLKYSLDGNTGWLHGLCIHPKNVVRVGPLLNPFVALDLDAFEKVEITVPTDRPYCGVAGYMNRYWVPDFKNIIPATPVKEISGGLRR